MGESTPPTRKEASGEGTEPTMPGALPVTELENIVAEFIFRTESGEDPTIEEYMARYPRHAEELAYLLSDESGPMPPLMVHTRKDAGDEAAADRVGNYELLDRISDGGGGTVFRARHAAERHLVALKVLDRLTVGDPRDFARFQAEAAMLRRMDLVNVVPVYETGEDRGRLYIAMKWIEGETLADLREAAKHSGHPLHAMDKRALLIARVARAFGAIHSQGILHRDVKPSNIIVDRLGEPMIIDFGIARVQGGADLTETGDGPLGTPRYLAPELLDGNSPSGPRADIYGLGLCLYELVCGVVSFVQSTRTDLFVQIRSRGPLDARRAFPGLSPALAAIIGRAVEIAPRRRYGTMEELADDLERYVHGEAPCRETLRRAHPVRRFHLRHPRVLPASALLLVLLAFFGLVWASRAASERRLLERVSSLKASLTRSALAPPEFHVISATEEDAAADEALRWAPSDPEIRLRASWVAYRRGDFARALSVLGSVAPSSSGGRLWLAYVRLLLDEGSAAEGRSQVTSTAPGLVSEEGRGLGDRFSVEVGQRHDLSPEDNRLRRRVQPPRLENVVRLVKSSEPFDDGSLTHALCALVLSQSITSGTAQEPDRAIVDRVRDHADAALAADPSLSGLRWVRGLLELRHGDPTKARQDFEWLAREHPENFEVAYAHALSHALVPRDRGDQEVASREFARAARLGPRREPSGAWHRPWVLDEVRRKFHGWWALHELGRGRGDVVGSILTAWVEGLSVTLWQDDVFPALLRAAVAIKEKNADAALAELRRAKDRRPELALTSKIEAGVWKALLHDDAQASKLLQASLQASQQAPKDLQSYLRGSFFGLRAQSRHDTFVSGIERVRTPGR